MLGGILLEWFGSLAVPGWAGLGGSVLGGALCFPFSVLGFTGLDLCVSYACVQAL